MAMQNVGVGNIHTPLNHDFGHAPVGNLNGRRIEPVAPQEPRVSFLSRIGTSISNLGSRIVSALTPQSVRTEREFRQGLEASSEHVASMLAALSNGENGPYGQALHDLLEEFPQVARPVTQHGTDTHTVLNERLKVHISNMTPSQRADLVRGMAIMEHSPAHVREFVAEVRTVLHQKMAEDAMTRLDSPITQALDRSGQIFRLEAEMAAELERVTGEGDPVQTQRLQTQIADQMAKQYDLLVPAKHAAQQILDDFGMDGLSLTKREELTTNLINHVLNAAAERGHEDGFQTNHLMVLLPVKDLAAQFNADPAAILGTAHTSLDLQAAMNGAIAARTARLESAVQRHAAELPALQQAGDSDAYISRLAQTQTMLTNLNVIDRDLHYSLSPGVPEVVATLEQAVADQREQLMQNAAAALQPTIQAALANDLSAVLGTLNQAQARTDTYLEQLNSLGVNIEGADKTMALREELIVRALNELDDASMSALGRALETPQTHALHHSLTNAGVLLISDMDEGARERAGRMMFNRGVDVELLRSTVMQTLGNRGLEKPPSAQRPEQPDTATLSAIRRGLDVQLSVNNGELRVDGLPVKPALQRAINQNLSDMIARLKDAITNDTDPTVTIQLPGQNGEIPVSVATTLMSDLGRATYVQHSHDDHQTTVLSRPGEHAEQLKLDAIRTIFNTVAGGNPDMLRLLSHLAHQGSLATLPNTIMANPDLSPIRTPDGSPGMFAGGNAMTTFHIIPDTHGGATLHFQVDQYSENFMHRLDGQEGQPGQGPLPDHYFLDRQSSYQRYSYSIYVDANLNAAPVGVATYDANYQVAPQDAEH